jgi:hypothetical protein
MVPKKGTKNCRKWAHACNSCTWETEDYEFKVSLGYVVIPCFEKRKEKMEEGVKEKKRKERNQY